jgi:hypothetical protein
MKLYMFRTVRLSIIRSLFTVNSAMAYVIQVCRQLSSRTRMVLLERSKEKIHCHLFIFSMSRYTSEQLYLNSDAVLTCGIYNFYLRQRDCRHPAEVSVSLL